LSRSRECAERVVRRSPAGSDRHHCGSDAEGAVVRVLVQQPIDEVPSSMLICRTLRSALVPKASHWDERARNRHSSIATPASSCRGWSQSTLMEDVGPVQVADPR
jgi:hypothetical protein